LFFWVTPIECFWNFQTMLYLISLMDIVLWSVIVSLQNTTTYLNWFKLRATGVSLFIQNPRFVFKLVNFHLITFLQQRYIPNVIVSCSLSWSGVFMQQNSNEILYFAYFWDKSKLMTFKSICIKHQWHILIRLLSEKL